MIKKSQKLKIKHLINITSQATKASLNTKTTKIESKIPKTTGFVTTPNFNRLKKVSLGLRMTEAEKFLATKIQVRNAIDLTAINKVKHYLSYFLGKQHKITLYFNRFVWNTKLLSISTGLQVF